MERGQVMTLFDYGWSPLGELDRMRRGMDELLERFGAFPGFGSGSAFPMNIYDNGDELLVALEAPGVARDSFRLNVRENVLTVTGTRAGAEYKDASALREETPRGEFTRTLRMPAKVDADRVEAKYRDGILQIRMPKSEEAKPKQIAIEA
jgi:HSP20 family protein